MKLGVIQFKASHRSHLLTSRLARIYVEVDENSSRCYVALATLTQLHALLSWITAQQVSEEQSSVTSTILKFAT